MMALYPLPGQHHGPLRCPKGMASPCKGVHPATRIVICHRCGTKGNTIHYHTHDANILVLNHAGRSLKHIVLGRVQQIFEHFHDARSVALCELQPQGPRLPGLHQRHQLLLLATRESCPIDHCSEATNGPHEYLAPLLTDSCGSTMRLQRETPQNQTTCLDVSRGVKPCLVRDQRVLRRCVLDSTTLGMSSSTPKGHHLGVSSLALVPNFMTEDTRCELN